MSSIHTACDSHFMPLFFFDAARESKFEKGEGCYKVGLTEMDAKRKL